MIEFFWLVFIFSLAGSDTTAISLRACFYYLMKNPRVYQKLVTEIDEADKNGQPSTYVTFEECVKMPYLSARAPLAAFEPEILLTNRSQAVMREAMRNHPGVSFPLERYVPDGGATVCGVHLAAGTNVSITAPVVHHDNAVFGDDEEEFRPERWLETTDHQQKAMDLAFFAVSRHTKAPSLDDSPAVNSYFKSRSPIVSLLSNW